MEEETAAQSVRNGKRPEATLTGIPTGSVATAGPICIPLYQMAFALHILDSPGSEGQAFVIHLVTDKCLEENIRGDRPSDYKIELLTREYKNALDKEKPPWEVEVSENRGDFHWNCDNQLKTIKTQNDFELAITHLYKGGHCEGPYLNFTFKPDSYRDRITGAIIPNVPQRQKSQGTLGRSTTGKSSKPLAGITASTSKVARVIGHPEMKVEQQRDNTQQPGKVYIGRGSSGPATSTQGKVPGSSAGDQSSNQPCRVMPATQSVGRGGFQQPSTGQLGTSPRSQTSREGLHRASEAASTGQSQTQIMGTSRPKALTELEVRSKAAEVGDKTKNEYTVSKAKEAVLSANGDVERAIALLTRVHSKGSKPASSSQGKTGGAEAPGSKVPTEAEIHSMATQIRLRTSYLKKGFTMTQAEEALKPCNYNVDEAVASLTGVPVSKLAPPPGSSTGQSRNRNQTPTLHRRPSPKAVGEGSKDGAKAEELRRPGRTSQPAGLRPGPTSSSATASHATTTSNLNRQPNQRVSATSAGSLESANVGGGNKASETIKSKLKRTLTITGSPSSSASGTPPRKRSTLAEIGEKVKRPFQSKLNADELDEKYNKLFKQTQQVEYRAGGDKTAVDERLEGLEGAEVDDETAFPDEEDDEAPKLSEPIMKLKGLQNMSALKQLHTPGTNDLSRWQECCLLFRIDPDKTGIDERVAIAGIQTPLFQYQAFAVYWQMKTSREVGGGIVADTPGLGKTLISLALIVVERQLCMMWDDVVKSRENNDGNHLQQNEPGVCPTAKLEERKGWIACPCASSSPASRMPKKMGVRIAVVPASLMSNWRKNWAAHVDSSNTKLGMRLLLAHTESYNNALTAEVATNPMNLTFLRAEIKHRAPDAARGAQDRFLVLTTPQSYDSFIGNFAYRTIPKQGGKGPKEKVQTLQEFVDKRSNTSKLHWHKGGQKFKISFGIGIVDECHDPYKRTAGGPGVLARLPGNPFCWGLSGTPLDQTPRVVEGILWAIEQQAAKPDIFSLETGWAQVPRMVQFKYSVLDNIARDFQKLLDKKPTDSVDQVVARFKPFLTTFMIRRDGKHTTWFGHKLMKLKPHAHRDIFLEHNAKYDQDITEINSSLERESQKLLEQLQAKWEEHRKGPKPTELKHAGKMQAAYKQRMMATCPSLCKFVLQPYNLSLKSDELVRMRVSRKDNVYADHLDEIFQNSPKLLWLRSFIGKLQRTEDYAGNEQKLVIMSYFPTIVFIVKLVIERYVAGGKGRVGLIHQKMSMTERDAVTEAFTDEMREGKDGVLRRTQKEYYRYLVGTTTLLCGCHQLTRACNVVLLEPAHIYHQEVQAYARVHRIPQDNPASFSFRLINEGSEIEQRTLERQAQRQEFAGKAKESGNISQVNLEGDVMLETGSSLHPIAESDEGMSLDSRISHQCSLRSSTFPVRSSPMHELDGHRQGANLQDSPNSARFTSRDSPMEGLKEDRQSAAGLGHNASDVEDSHENLMSENGSINSSPVQEAYPGKPLRRIARTIPPRQGAGTSSQPLPAQMGQCPSTSPDLINPPTKSQDWTLPRV